MSKDGTKIEQAVVDYTQFCKVNPYTDQFDDGEAVYAAGHYLTTVGEDRSEHRAEYASAVHGVVARHRPHR